MGLIKQLDYKKHKEAIERFKTAINNFEKLRLVYVDVEKFDYAQHSMILENVTISQTLNILSEMKMEDAIKIVSYFTDMLESETNLDEPKDNLVNYIVKLMENNGFKADEEDKSRGHYRNLRVYNNDPLSDKKFRQRAGVLDLFFVSGDFEEFKKSPLYSRYFDWYKDGISQEQAKEICNKSTTTSVNQ